MTVTTTDVRKKITELAAAKPDFVYQKPAGETFCQYVHKDEDGRYIEGEGCIVGQALVALGFPPECLDEETDAEALFYMLGVEGSSEDGWWCADVQSHQDIQKPWGVAVERADDQMPERS